MLEPQPPRQLSETELQQWQFAIAQANYNNILCHCKVCDREWVASTEETPCQCGSNRVEHIACWQFPDG